MLVFDLPVNFSVYETTDPSCPNSRQSRDGAAPSDASRWSHILKENSKSEGIYSYQASYALGRKLQKCHWHCIQRELDILSQIAREDTRTPSRNPVFEPGDFAWHAEANLYEAFYELLRERDYALMGSESRYFPTQGRYCVVLHRAGADKYVVCYLTTFGGAKGFDMTYLGPVAQYFGIPLGFRTFWPGIPPLKTEPVWKGGAFIMGIPAVRDGLQEIDTAVRPRLYPSELKRMKELINYRIEVLPHYQQALRHDELRFSQRHGHCRAPQPTETRERGVSQRLANVDAVPWHKRPRPQPLEIPNTFNNLTRLAPYMKSDLESCSQYLSRWRRPVRTVYVKPLPEPFFSPIFRANATNITRFIR